MANIHLKVPQPPAASLRDEVSELKRLLEEKEKLLKEAEESEAAASAAPSAAAPAAAAPQAGGENKEGGELSKKALKKLEQQKAKEAKKKAAGAAAEQQQQIKFVDGVFGPLPLIRSEQRTQTKWLDVTEITGDLEGQEVTVRARIAVSRKASAKLAFLVLRRKLGSVQAVLAEANGCSRDMIKWTASLSIESVVDVTGKVVRPAEPVKSCTQQDAELQVSKVRLVSSSLPVLPFQVVDAAGRTKDVNVNQDTRLECRWLDMRTPANISIWTLQSRVCQFFREYLTQERFVEIHSPKIIPAASEGGASVFKLGYFGKDAFLAQSPQLYKQMALQGDLERVFEIGPVFRSENCNTHRHLCEFVGLDVELEIKEHYYEVLDVAEGLFTYIFDNLREQCSNYIDTVHAQWENTVFVHKMTRETIDKLKIGILSGECVRESEDEYGALVKDLKTATLRLSYPKAVQLLNTVLDEKMEVTADLDTENEKKLGKLVKERYGVDFYILDWFPAEVRPFYTMPHPKDPRFSNSYDMFMRGEEISSGAQRVHDPALLEQKASAMGVDMKPLKDYVDSFKLGSWPHGGFGVGLERVVMLYLGLHNIRSCSLFPRDPKRNHP